LIKPSELAIETSKFFAEVIPKYLDSNCIKVIEGAVEETPEILKHPFDHIFYTGKPMVGKVIMRAAAEHLTPVTLELGGKNPTFVDSKVDIEVAAIRIAWAKTFNAGQTCLAPDYILIQRDFQDKFVAAIKEEIENFYGKDPKESPDYGRIISKRHVQRLANYFQDVKKCQYVVGGPETVDESDRFVPPTIIKNVKFDQKIMQDEIFGPILAVVPVESMDEAIEYVNSKPHPLAIYVFSSDSKLREKIEESTQSGSFVMNDVMMQALQSNLPFGGVGQSGMGAYHGKKSFETFSHMRSVLDKTVKFDLDFRYPPYSDKKLNTAKKIL